MKLKIFYLWNLILELGTEIWLQLYVQQQFAILFYFNINIKLDLIYKNNNVRTL